MSESSPLEVEIAHLRGLDLTGLRARWHSNYGRKAPAHLPRHLLFRILAYRLQADRIGDLDRIAQRHLDRVGDGAKDEGKRLLAGSMRSRGNALKPGTLLVREWRVCRSGSWCWQRDSPGTRRSIAASLKLPSPSPARGGTDPGFSGCGIRARGLSRVEHERAGHHAG